MKIAYYEENNYHTEIMGTFLEPFKNNSDIVIYVYNTIDKSLWVDFYKSKFTFIHKKNQDIIDDIDELDKIIIGTSINMDVFKSLFTEDKIKSIQHKIFYICHLKDDLKKEIINKTIVLTPLNTINKKNYILPLNNCIDNIKTKNKLIFGIVGRTRDTNRNVNDLILLVKKYSKFDFCVNIYARHIKFIHKAIIELSKEYPKHIKIFLKLSTAQMVQHFQNDVKFMCTFCKTNGVYHADRLTGIIPLSYNFNIPCIMDNKLSQIYNTQNCITYDNSITEIMERLINMKNEEYINIVNKLHDEKTNIINNNNILIKDILFN